MSTVKTQFLRHSEACMFKKQNIGSIGSIQSLYSDATWVGKGLFIIVSEEVQLDVVSSHLHTVVEKNHFHYSSVCLCVCI